MFYFVFVCLISRTWRRQVKRKIKKMCYGYLSLILIINNLMPQRHVSRKHDIYKDVFHKQFAQSLQGFNVNHVLTFPVTRNPGSLDSYLSSICEGHDENGMRFEWIRLRSFFDTRLPSSLSAIRLARSGFYYTGVNQECRCFSCGVSNSEWRDENVTSVHTRLSPNCRHLLGTNETNVPIASQTSNTGIPETSRNSAHCNESSHNTTNVPSLESGRGQCNISTNPQHDNTESHSNDRHLLDIDQSANSERHYVQRQSNVQTSHFDQRRQQNISNNVAYSAEERRTRLRENLEPLGINFDRPRYPSYAIQASRLSSYQNWPAHMTQTPRGLSTAGFLYAGYGDYVRCFFCGGGLRNWEHNDDPWVEHARWFPKCAFLLQNKGKTFVAMVQQLHNEEQRQNEPSSLPNQRNVSVGEDSITNLPAAIQVHEMGYTWDKIKDSYSSLRRTCQEVSVTDLVEHLVSAGDNSTFSATPISLTHNNENSDNSVSREENQAASRPSTAEELPQLVDNLSLSEETRSLIEENRQLREQRLCRICMDEDVSIAFLPCGHLCCCSHCAPAMRKCPICREFIKGTVKTYPA